MSIPSPVKRTLGLPVAGAIERRLRATGMRCGIGVMYHRVDDPAGDPARELVPALGAGLFEAQLRHLRRRYRVVPASELRDAAVTRRRGDRFPVAITFDDDLPSHARVATPILGRLGLVATFFVSGASLDSPRSFWWERLQRAVDRGIPLDSVLPAMGVATADPSPPGELHRVAETLIRERSPEDRAALAEGLLDLVGPDPPDAGMRAAELRALADAGMEIGFHTRSHEYLPTLEDDALARAMTEGRAELAEVVARPLTTLAYPYGGTDRRVADAARAAGYACAFSTEREAVDPDTDPMLIGRVEASFDSVGHFALQLARALVSAPRR